METFVFATYMVAVIALAISLYTLLEIREMRQQRKRDTINRRLQQITQTNKSFVKSSPWRK